MGREADLPPEIKDLITLVDYCEQTQFHAPYIPRYLFKSLSRATFSFDLLDFLTDTLSVPEIKNELETKIILICNISRKSNSSCVGQRINFIKKRKKNEKNEI